MYIYAHISALHIRTNAKKLICCYDKVNVIRNIDIRTRTRGLFSIAGAIMHPISDAAIRQTFSHWRLPYHRNAFHPTFRRVFPLVGTIV